MNNLSVISSRINSFGKLDRAKRKTISHQTVYLRTATLADDPILESNLSGMSEEYLKSLMISEEAKEIINGVGDEYVQALPNIKEPVTNVSKLIPKLNTFFNIVEGKLPSIDDISIEIRPAPLMAHSVYYFAQQSKELQEIEDKVREVLTHYEVPTEAVNLVIRMDGVISYKELTHLMTLLSVLLREISYEFEFIPGRVIGTFTTISE